MMFPSHLLASLLGCLLISRVRPLGPRGWLLALSFGVLIDMDHALQFPVYVATHDLADLTPAAMLAWGGAWQGFMHTPWALAIVIPASVIAVSPIPVLFWGLHMVQDFVIARHFVRFGGPLEWLIDLGLALVLLSFVMRDHRLHGNGAPLKAHVRARVAQLVSRPS